jgi:hypothetical protein
MVDRPMPTCTSATIVNILKIPVSSIHPTAAVARPYPNMFLRTMKAINASTAISSTTLSELT